MKPKMIIKNQNGGAVVEFAIILPLLIALLFGIVEFGLLLYNKQIITNACREGARAGIVSRTPRLSNGDIQNEVIKYGKAYLVTFGSATLDNSDIVIASPDDNDDTNGACVCSLPDAPTDERCLTFGCDLVVDVTYKYDFLVLFNPITLNAITIMKME